MHNKPFWNPTKLFLSDKGNDGANIKLTEETIEAIFQGPFPDNLKLAGVIPIFKKYDHFDKSNYMKLNQDRCYLLVSGDKYEYIWARVVEVKIFKSSCTQMFYKLDVLKGFAKFTGKHSC